MRSDRLVAILLILQRRTQVTAAEVAAELEVSERTARRDLDALGMAGLPVYSVQGRGGGWRLLGGARTDLSGLSEAEVRALFLVAGPAAGSTPEVKAALRKLVRALPASFRDHAEAAASSVVVDPHRWGAAGTDAQPPRFLAALQDAVIRGQQVRLGYVDATGTHSGRTVHPLGVVAKAHAWYLLANTDAGQRTFRVDRVTDVRTHDEPAERPPGFDLAGAWRQITAHAQHARPAIHVQGSCAPEGIGFLREALEGRLSVGAPGPDGRLPVAFTGPSEAGLAGHLAGLVEWLEISSPPGIREHLALIGAALTQRYS
ncbi:MAG: WYL domain-containing protein [Arthrobacter sp.]|jgi:predicted DNA-binding transcriptional regulator YafY|nr:WYL domain-containing protein [Arthrobacter sp.]